MAIDQGLYEQLLAVVQRRYRRYCLLLAVLSFGLLVIIGFLAWRNHQPVTVTPLSEEQARTPAGVQLAADQALVPVSKQQVREVALKIAQTEDGLPDRVIVTTGKEVENTVENVRQETKADFAIVTNPRKPQEKPVVEPNEPVKLNVYNIKAYPRNMVEISAGVHGGDIAYLKRVTVPKIPVVLPKGTVAYAGPFIRTEYGGGRLEGGIRFVFTF